MAAGDATPRLVRDLAPGPAGSQPRFMTGLNATQIAFVATLEGEGDSLWISDGTASGTGRVILEGYGDEKIKIFSTDAVDNIERLREWNSGLLLTVNSAGGTSLWKTDGTNEGTEVIFKYEFEYTLNRFTEVGKWLYFVFGNTSVYRTLGTLSSTEWIERVDSWSQLVEFQDSLFFSDLQLGSYAILYKYDKPYTYFIAELPHSRGHVSVTNFTVVGDHLYFNWGWQEEYTDYPEPYDPLIFRSDGSTSGTFCDPA